MCALKQAGVFRRLLADSKTLDQIRVSLGALVLEVVEESSPVADELQQPAPRVVIFGVSLEVFGEVADALTEYRYLDLR